MRGPLTRDRDDEEADRAAHGVIRCATHQERPVSGDLLPVGAEHGWVDDRSEGSKQILISRVLAPPFPTPSVSPEPNDSTVPPSGLASWVSAPSSSMVQVRG